MKKSNQFMILVLSIIFMIIGINAESNNDELNAIEQLRKKGVKIRIERGHSGMFALEFDSKTNATDDDLKQLKVLCNKIKELYVFDYNAGNILTYVKEMNNLEAFSIDLKINDNDLRYFSNLKRLESLGLIRNGIKGDGFKFLAVLPNLVELNIIGNPIRDENLKFFENCEKLRIINLNETTVTDKALDIIANFKSKELVAVNVIGTKVTKKAAQRFFKLRGVEACVDADDCHLR